MGVQFTSAVGRVVGRICLHTTSTHVLDARMHRFIRASTQRVDRGEVRSTHVAQSYTLACVLHYACLPIPKQEWKQCGSRTERTLLDKCLTFTRTADYISASPADTETDMLRRVCPHRRVCSDTPESSNSIARSHCHVLCNRGRKARKVRMRFGGGTQPWQPAITR